MLRCNKRKHLDKPHAGVPIKRWFQAVKYDVSVLGHLGSNPAVTTSDKSRSLIKEKLAVLKIKTYFPG